MLRRAALVALPLSLAPAGRAAGHGGHAGTGPAAGGGDGGSDVALPVLEAAGRFAQDAAIALALGGVAFLLVAWLPALGGAAGAGRRWLAASKSFAREARRQVVVGAAVGAAGAAAGLVGVSATAGGIDARLEQRAGAIYGLALTAWLVLGAFVGVRTRAYHVPGLRAAQLGSDGLALRAPHSAAASAVLAALAVLALAPAAAGVGVGSSLLLLAGGVHVAAMAGWLGGLVALLAAARASRVLRDEERAALLHGAVSRFSGFALACVCAVAASGVLLATEHLSAPAELLDTAYGRLLLAKGTAFALVLSIAAGLRRHTLPSLARPRGVGGAARMLRESVGLELSLALVLLALSAVLAGTAPPS